jgi:large subunit ribosomal protein L9
MEIIMLKDVAKVGQKFEVVTVSEGYAINFLIPKGLAKAATAGAKKEIELKKGKFGEARSVEAGKVIAGIKDIDGKSVTMRAKANEQGHLFAALHPDTINAAVYDQLGVCLPDAVFGEETLKEIGTFALSLEGEGTKGVLTVLVEREG